MGTKCLGFNQKSGVIEINVKHEDNLNSDLMNSQEKKVKEQNRILMWERRGKKRLLKKKKGINSPSQNLKLKCAEVWGENTHRKIIILKKNKNNFTKKRRNTPRTDTQMALKRINKVRNRAKFPFFMKYVSNTNSLLELSLLTVRFLD